MYRTRSAHAIALTLAATLAAACTQSDTAPDPSAVKPLDARVTDLLPIGPHEMSFELYFSGPSHTWTMTATGYVDMPDSYDLEQDCAYDLALTETFVFAEDHPNYEASPTRITSFEFTKAYGATSWARVTEVAADLYNSTPGEWYDGADPMAPAPLIPFTFLLNGTSGGGHYWCEMRRIDQATRLADPATGALEWDQDAFVAALQVPKREFALALADAAGVGGFERRAFVKTWTEATAMTGESLTPDLTMARDGDTLRWDLWDRNIAEDRPFITITFTPTERRAVDDVDAETYLERVAASEELQAEVFAD